MNNNLLGASKNIAKMLFNVRPMEDSKFLLLVLKDNSELDPDISIGFSKVSSFGYSVDVEEIDVGGVNDRKIVLPKSVKANNVSCEHGVTYDDGLYNWIKDIKEGKYKKRNMLLIAYGGGISVPIAQINKITNIATMVRKIWSFEDVLPSKWEISGFDAQGNSVVIESLELIVENIKEISLN